MAQVAQMVLQEVADVGIATESLADADGLVSLPCYDWQHAVVLPASHPLAQVDRGEDDTGQIPLGMIDDQCYSSLVHHV